MMIWCGLEWTGEISVWKYKTVIRLELPRKATTNVRPWSGHGSIQITNWTKARRTFKYSYWLLTLSTWKEIISLPLLISCVFILSFCPLLLPFAQSLAFIGPRGPIISAFSLLDKAVPYPTQPQYETEIRIDDTPAETATRRQLH